MTMPDARAPARVQHGTVTTLLLIHGGLWEERIDAEVFWRRPGIAAGLQQRGFEVLAPDRPDRPSDWTAEVDHLAMVLPAQPVTVVAGSNGCSAAVRLALAFPHSVDRLVLAWPATAHNPGEGRIRRRLAELGASPNVIRALLTGQTLRGVTDDELATINMRVGIVPSVWHPSGRFRI